MPPLSAVPMKPSASLQCVAVGFRHKKWSTASYSDAPFVEQLKWGLRLEKCADNGKWDDAKEAADCLNDFEPSYGVVVANTDLNPVGYNIHPSEVSSGLDIRIFDHRMALTNDQVKAGLQVRVWPC